MTRSAAPLWLAASLALGASPAAAVAQETAGDLPTLARDGREPAKVMILGTFHFHNPNADYAKFEGIDVLAPERQREIEEVADRLAAFAPTKISVEKPLAASDSLQARYDRYRSGRLELSRNEVEQVGFRLAARLGLDQVYPIDVRMGMPLDSLMTWAGEHDPAFARRFDAYIAEIVSLLDRMQQEETIGENLRFLNEPENVCRANEPYAVQAAEGAGEGYIGARVVAVWYDRNLRIFGNLARIAGPGDRILLVIGAGHAPILRHLVRSHPEMRLVEAVDYLD
jgi:hypothetical protein